MLNISVKTNLNQISNIDLVDWASPSCFEPFPNAIFMKLVAAKERDEVRVGVQVVQADHAHLLSYFFICNLGWIDVDRQCAFNDLAVR